MNKKTITILTILIITITLTLTIHNYTTKNELKLEETNTKNNEKNLIYQNKNQTILKISLMNHEGYKQQSNEIPIKFSAWHQEKTKIKKLTIELELPKPTSQHPGEIYLKNPSGKPYPPIHFQRQNDFDAKLKIPDMGIQGEGTVNLEFLIKPKWQIKNETEINFRIKTEIKKEGILQKNYIAETYTSLKIENPTEHYTEKKSKKIAEEYTKNIRSEWKEISGLIIGLTVLTIAVFALTNMLNKFSIAISFLR